MRILTLSILLVFFMASAVGQVAVNVRSLTVSSDGIAALNNFMVTQVNDIQTGLTDALDAVSTSVRVDDGSVMVGTDIIKIGGEAMQITAKTGRNLTVTRGVLGTTAASHTANSPVQILKYKTYALLFQAHITNMVSHIMDTYGYPTKATQDAVIATAKAAKDAAVAGAVQ